MCDFKNCLYVIYATFRQGARVMYKMQANHEKHEKHEQKPAMASVRAFRVFRGYISL